MQKHKLLKTAEYTAFLFGGRCIFVPGQTPEIVLSHGWETAILHNKTMKPIKLIVTAQHRSNYPDPIAFPEGTLLEIGEEYTGNEGWEGWYFCTVPGQGSGWVPRQLIEWTGDTFGRALESYSAKELNVEPGEILWGSERLNGWIWCIRSSAAEEGWVPLDNVSPADR